MDKDGKIWDGLLKWSLAHSDGTLPSRNLSEEDRKWFMEAMQAQTVDVVKRMKEITLVMQTPWQILEAQGVSATDIEGVLGELQEHVGSIDMANNLHSINGLVPLIGFLKNPNAAVRGKAAEVVTTIVQNNPKGQNVVMESGGLDPLLHNFTSDPDTSSRTKALGAISSLIRHNSQGIVNFRLANGYSSLRDALNSGDTRFQRKALNLLHYLLGESRNDAASVAALGFPRLMIHLARSRDAGVCESALLCLLDVAGLCGSGDMDMVKAVLEERVASISAMSADELAMAREEAQLVDSLWSCCYGEPSPILDRGLFDSQGCSTLPPDVARRIFEQPCQSLPMAGEMTGTPLLLGLPSTGGGGA